jgi:hypothetical protein
VTSSCVRWRQTNEHRSGAFHRPADGRLSNVDAVDPPRRRPDAGADQHRDRHREELQRRIADIDQHPEARETTFQWIKEEAFSLSLGIERWIADG